MPLVAEAVDPDSDRRGAPPRIAYAIGAILLIGAILFVVGALIGGDLLAQRTPQSPFSIGVREAPASGAIGAFILNMQAHFYAAMTDALRQGEGGGLAFWPLLVMCFCYGVLHAAGPGHGKAVVAAFVLSDRPAIRRSVLLCAAAAAVQASVAVAIVGILAVLLHMTASSITKATGRIELLSFGAIAGYGAWLTWTKAGRIAWRQPAHHHPARQAAGWAGCQACAASLRPPERTRAGFFGAALAAGMRPCSGAIIVLAFALSQDIWAVGVVAVFAMALGTTCTTITCALAALLAKRWALQLTTTLGSRAAMVIPALETGLGACVFWLGVVLLDSAL